MALVPKQERDPTVALAARALAAGVPLAATLTTASPYAYWLDAGEFVEAAVQLDIPHPPGHPLAALLGYAISLVPLGPLALRVALAQALCAAVAAGFLFSAIEVTVRALGVRHDRLSVPIGLGGTWLVAGSYAFWFQAVRPEVYALSAMLLAIAIERVARLEAAWPTHDCRPLRVAALALGLALANHHFMAVLVLPALAPTFARVYRARGPRPLLVALGATAAGLAAYAYLPVRSHVDPPVDLGDPSDLGRFLWVVSARAYQHADRYASGTPLDRAGEVLIAIVENVSPVALVLAAAGLWALLRAPGARRIGWMWLAVLVFACAGRTWMGNTLRNPDALGYLVPAFAAIAALAAAFAGAVAAQLAGAGARAPGFLVTALALGVAALGLAAMEPTAERASLAAFHAPDDFDDRRIRALPPRAVVIAHLPQTVFRYWEIDATEQVRPDVTLVAMPFLGYPGMVERLVQRDPTLSELLRGHLLEGEIRRPDLQSLAARRPVLIELDVRVPPSLYDTLAPAPGTLLYEVVDAGATADDVREAGARRAADIDALVRALGSDAEDAETRAQLLWIHYVDALYYAGVGALERARQSCERALALAPEAAELVALHRALSDPGLEGPLDVRPFLAGRDG
jgi:hypothetical protein